jgi:hypothetical protein
MLPPLSTIWRLERKGGFLTTDVAPSLLARVRELMKQPEFKRNDKKQRLPMDEFVMALLEHGGSAYALAKKIGVSHSMVAERRRNIEAALGIELPRGRPEVWKKQAHRTRQYIEVDNAVMLVGSDLHCWPEIYGTAMAAFVDFNRRLKPDFVILNGDEFDGAQISRHSRLGFDKRPSPAEEIEALRSYLDDVLKANPNGKRKRTRGNHTTRLETYLASNAPLAEGMKGTTLSDHLPGWEDECISIHVNSPECIIKHRGRHNGLHGTFNELRALGTSFVHGHLHAQKLVSFENAHGSIYGVDLGMLAPMDHPGFDYVEDGIPNWRSGFAVLTFRDGKLQIPELATVTNEARGEIFFRGQTIRYDL